MDGLARQLARHRLLEIAYDRGIAGGELSRAKQNLDQPATVLCFAKHDIDGKGTIASLGESADTWISPPALTLQYHFTAWASSSLM